MATTDRRDGRLLGRLRPARPAGVGLVAVLVALLLARATLPERVVLVHLADTGGSALAASRADLLLLAGVLVVGLVVTWLVAAAAVLVVPVRHVPVPHGEHWKAPAHRRELRDRLLHHVSLGVGVVWWSLALQLVAAVLGQGDGPLAAWWIPAVISLATVLVLVVGGLVLLLTAWRPGASPRPARASSPRAVVTLGSAAGAATARGASRTDAAPGRPARAPTAPRPRGAAGTEAPARGRQPAERPRPARTTSPPRDTSSWNPDGPAGPAARPGRPGKTRGSGGASGGDRPPRPYQPMPKRPPRGGDERDPRG